MTKGNDNKVKREKKEIHGIEKENSRGVQEKAEQIREGLTNEIVKIMYDSKPNK